MGPVFRRIEVRGRVDTSLERYVAMSYPANHTYRVRPAALVPRSKLKRRARRVFRLLPRKIGTFLDVGCSKGYYVLRAAQLEACRSAVGIDVLAEAVRAAESLRVMLDVPKAHFAHLQLDEFAAEVEAYGGPFDVCLLLNTYHYLFWGSHRDPRGYRDHDRIFDDLARVCRGTLLFSALTELADLPPYLQAWARKVGLECSYRETEILRAAQRWFECEPCGRLGRRPVWRMNRRSPEFGPPDREA